MRDCVGYHTKIRPSGLRVQPRVLNMPGVMHQIIVILERDDRKETNLFEF